MRDLVLVAFGGATGSVLRYGIGVLVGRLVLSPFPWATLLINVLGSFIIGAFAALTGGEGRFSENDDLRVLVMVGLCGGFTTFSSFSLQTMVLLRAGDTMWALANVVASVGLCLIGVAIGMTVFTRA